MELTLDQALQQGVEAHKTGQVQEADRLSTAILKAQPKHPDANHNMGVLAVGVGKVQESLPFFKTALEANPNTAQFWLSYIDALIKLERLADAQAVFDQAKGNGARGDGFDKLKQQLKGVGQTAIYASKNQNAPKDQLQSLMDDCHQGQFQKALDKAAQMLQVFPESIPLYNVSSAAYASLGRLDLALDMHKKATNIMPNNPEAFYNIGVTYNKHGKLEEAIKAYSKALAIKPDFHEAWNNIGNTLVNVKFNRSSPEFRRIITSLLSDKSYVRPKDICSAAISLLKFDPVIKNLIQKNPQDRNHVQTEETIKALSELRILLKLMSVCPLADLGLEEIIKYIRAEILDSVFEMAATSGLILFQSALALQCFTNEYIYTETDIETKALEALEILVKNRLTNGEQPTPQSVLCLASYKALHEYEWCDLIAITSDIEEVYVRQVIEPKQEVRMKPDIKVLNEVSDKVSSKVREQYEESPYPRWINLGLRLKPAPISVIASELKLKLFNPAVNKVEAPNILIAGCGTGQHSIETAARFKNAKVLAIDLSLSSLAYAKRKTAELYFKNIDYMQADILDLGKLDMQFDIVESAGVLHHMDNPMAGWRVLTDCIKQGGLMKIGLYSELARQHIVKIREEICQSDIGSSDFEMKSFRKIVIKADEEHHKKILDSPDFYSISNLRDLLFHVQEHRFTLLKIKDCIDELGLKFCGFEGDKIVSHFKLTNTGSDDHYDLDKWAAFEEINPNAFMGMYQFWCQKV